MGVAIMVDRPMACLFRRVLGFAEGLAAADESTGKGRVGRACFDRHRFPGQRQVSLQIHDPA
jgi:hypothetical protein